jgi:hypothetical protein
MPINSDHTLSRIDPVIGPMFLIGWILACSSGNTTPPITEQFSVAQKLAATH